MEAAVDAACTVEILDIAEVPPLENFDKRLLDGLTHPAGDSGPLSSRLTADEPVVIVVSDSFRKTGADLFLPGLLDYLNQHGVADERIAFLFATGTHRSPTEAEKAVILGGRVYDRFRNRAIAHAPADPAQLVFRGTTSRGTPVYLNRLACEAGLVIVTGTVVYHYFGGFGGGRKAIVPGIAGVQTIAANHSLNLHPVEDRLNPDVAIGRTTGNPVAEDMLEAARYCDRTFLINTVLNRHGAIAGLFCGDLETAHEAACGFARNLYTAPINEAADLVIASAGGAKNFVQSHKALYNAFQAVKPAGVIVLAAPAKEGFGGNRFQEWLALGSREAIIAELRKNAEINGQTALSTLEKARNTIFLTELSAEDVGRLGGTKAGGLEEALSMARERLRAAGVSGPRCYVMPSASYSVPVLGVC